MDKKVIILTGAGISKPSGISTFRDTDGLWENHKIEDICSAGCLDTNYEATIKFYNQRRKEISDKNANIAHKTIAKLKDKYPDLIEVITQNVDDMFEKVNCKDVLHLHGFLPEIKCMSCADIINIAYEEQNNSNIICKKCAGKMRPNIVFFGEMAPNYEEMYKKLEECGLLVVIGTSGYVIDVSFLTQYADFTILNNFESSEAIIEECFNKKYYECATTAILKIEQDIENFINEKRI
ncbi:MAG: NAD-dependent deacetylase [Arcobacter sp.]|nr:MAG: NAD-dependent deacetylase [Arcobacter sp.]